MQYVLKGVEPLYVFLHFADQDKILNMSEVLLQFNICIGEYESLLHEYPTDREQYMRVIKPRMGGVSNSTFVNAGTCYFLICNLNSKHKYFFMQYVIFICNRRFEFTHSLYLQHHNERHARPSRGF
jgi:hypothetical protein